MPRAFLHMRATVGYVDQEEATSDNDQQSKAGETQPDGVNDPQDENLPPPSTGY